MAAMQPVREIRPGDAARPQPAPDAGLRAMIVLAMAQRCG